MSKSRLVTGGGRAVEVSPERLAGWFDRFADHHGGIVSTSTSQDRVEVRANDGATAVVLVPFGPLDSSDKQHPGLEIESLLSHVLKPRRIGLLLVRLGAHSLGVAQDGKVMVSSTDRHLVHGRNKAGGWSQQRFARRREGQARQALHAAADDVVRVLLPIVEELDAIVLGGDRRAIEALRADRRLTSLLAMAEPRILDVPEPRRTVLDDAAIRARAVEILITNSAETAGSQ